MAWKHAPKPDKILAHDQLEALQALLRSWGTEMFCQAMFWILIKVPTRSGLEETRTVPFRWNRIQRHLHANEERNNRILKGRQQGMSTYELIVRLLLPILTEEGKTGLMVAQNHKYASDIFAIAHRAYKLFGALDPRDDSLNEAAISLHQNLLHTVYSNRKELVFDILDSRLIVESAEVTEAGQGVTVHHLVCSEAPRWPGDPEETMSNLLGALVPGGTRDEEGTANGAAGYFYEKFLASMNLPAGKRDCKPHFYPWWWSEDYQLKLSEKEARELAKDLEADEALIVQRIQGGLDEVTWVTAA